MIQTIEPDYKHWDEEYAKYINSLKLVWLLGDEQKVQGDISVAAVRLAASRLGQAAALGQLGSKWKAEPA